MESEKLEALKNYNNRIEEVILQLNNCKVDLTQISLVDIKNKAQKLSDLIGSQSIEKLTKKVNAFKEYFPELF